VAASNISKLFLKIITRQGVLFNSEIKSLSSRNDRGPFDVLREHAQFISIIKDKITIRMPDGKVQEIPVDNGVMRVKGELIQVFLGIKQ
jgi:F-type H+-transporting ATPase subunit epsilon